jgi:hypothetical protein
MGIKRDFDDFISQPIEDEALVAVGDVGNNDLPLLISILEEADDDMTEVVRVSNVSTDDGVSSDIYLAFNELATEGWEVEYIGSGLRGSITVRGAEGDITFGLTQLAQCPMSTVWCYNWCWSESFVIRSGLLARIVARFEFMRTYANRAVMAGTFVGREGLNFAFRSNTLHSQMVVMGNRLAHPAVSITINFTLECMDVEYLEQHVYLNFHEVELSRVSGGNVSYTERHQSLYTMYLQARDIVSGWLH